MSRLLPILLSLISFTHALGQDNDSIRIHTLLQEIATEQVRTDGEFYKGTFPSFRECRGFPHNYRPDNNIFFTAITVFTLRELWQMLDENEKLIAKKIIDSAQPAFAHYTDKTGSPFYSFWPNGKGILPHSFFINKIKLIDMGQDADDAVMSLMALDAPVAISSQLKDRLLELSNGKRMTTNSTRPVYRKYEAYSTWLGYKMKPDFDLSVHCNILYFMLDKGLPLAAEDTATINLIGAIIKNRDYEKSPALISPYYARAQVL